MNWLITGGCGFIGKNLVRFLLAKGESRIRVVDNLSVGTRGDLKWAAGEYSETLSGTLDDFPEGEVKLIVGDIRDSELAKAVVAGADAVVHLAANSGVEQSVRNPLADFETNASGTLNYLEAARRSKVKRFVFASSSAPIGECEPPIHEEVAPHPVSPYGAGKLAGEGYCSAYFGTYGLETVALRFGNVYGPGSRHKTSVVAKFIRQALDGETLEIYGDGNQTRDFIFIDDLVEAIWKATTVDGIGGETFQIATAAETTLNELVNRLVLILEENGVARIQKKYADPRPGDVFRNYSDTSKAERLLGWRAKTDLLAGLLLTYNDLKDANQAS